MRYVRDPLGLAVTFAMVAVILIWAGCAVNTSSNIDLNPKDILYTQDARTGLCFAVVASEKATSFSTSGLGLTHVPCTAEVLRLVGD